MKHHAADHLDVVMALPEHALGGLAHRGEGFGQQIVEAFPGLDPLAKAKRLVLEIILAHRRNGRLEGVDLDDSRSERRSEEHTSELQSLMRISYAVFCLKKKKLQ